MACGTPARAARNKSRNADERNTQNLSEARRGGGDRSPRPASPGRARPGPRPGTRPGFEVEGLADVLKSLGATNAAESRDITITAPDIAENGAVVPVAVTSKIPNTQSISIVAEKNPFPLAATFDVANGGEPYVSTRDQDGRDLERARDRQGRRQVSIRRSRKSRSPSAAAARSARRTADESQEIESWPNR